MPTSSIFHNVKITDPVKAEAFINAMDAADKAPRQKNEPLNAIVTDPDKIREMMARRKKKYYGEK